MKRLITLFASLALLACASTQAQNLLVNGNLDQTYQQEIVPGFFLPKPAMWVNEGFRTITGPYEDEMSSEPWAGPAPTPVTADDWGVFFKPFSGNAANGPATGHLFQDNPATPGMTYILSGWAGAEANFLGRAVFAIEFLDAGGNEIPLSGFELDFTASLFIPNGQPFNYKEYTLSAVAPAGAASVRARASMIDGIANPAGGGQAYVIDDFELVIPEPSVISLAMLGMAGLLAYRRRKP
jgi:hypothetical protein